MTQSVIGALRVNLGLDSAQFSKGASQAQKSLNNMRNQFVAVAGVAAAVGGALTALTVKTSQTAAEIKKFSQVANALPSEFQKWSAASKTVGIEQEKLADILKDVNDRVGDFLTTGGGPMADFFENIAPKVDITADAFRNLSGPEALQLYVSSLEKAGASQQEMTFYLEAMASDATALIPLLQNSGAEMSRLGDNAADLGGIMSNETVVSLSGFKLALLDAGTAIQGVGYRISGELAPALTTLTVAFSNSMREGGLLRTVTDGLIENLDRLGTYVAVAVTGFGLRYVAALVAAKVATLTLAGAFTFLKGALIRTGIGALIVGAGELTFQFSKLVKATGSFGDALNLLKDVALEVWDRIGLGVDFVTQSIAAMSADAKAWFLGALRAMAGAFVDFTWTVAEGLNSLFGSNLQGASAIITQELGLAENAARDAGQAATDAANAAKEGFTAPLASLEALRSAVESAADETDDAGVPIKELRDLLSDNGGGGGGKSLDKAAQDAAKSAEELADEIERLEFEADPVLKYNDALQDLNEIMATGDLSQGAYDATLQKLNDELADQTPLVNDVASAWGDFLAGGLQDFGGFVDNILSSFRNLISEMIATAVRNKIFIPIVAGVTGTGGVASAAGAVGEIAGGAGEVLGGAGGLLGSIGSLGSAFAGGFANTIGATFGAGGGLMSGIASAGAQVGTALTGGSIASIAGAVGAVAPYALAAVAAFKLLDGAFKRTYASSGYSATLGAQGELTNAREDRYFKGSTFKSGKVVQLDLNQEIEDTIGEGAKTVAENSRAMAESLGLATDAMDDFEGAAFNYSFNAGAFDPEKLQERIEAGFQDLQDGLANTVFDFSAVAMEGETAGQAMQRFADSLTVVNQALQYMGQPTMALSVASGQAAANIVQLSGGLQQFASQADFFAANFFTDAEQLQMAANALHQQFAALNMTTPNTAMAFRALVEAQDLTTTAGQETYAALMQVAPAFMQVAQAAASAANTAASAAAQATGSAQAAAQTALTVTIPAQQSVAAAQAQATAAAAANAAAMKRAAAAAARQAAQAKAQAAANAAAAAAQQAANEAAAAAKAIADERYALETRYYRAIGDTVTLREREIAALDTANQAFGRMVIQLEEAKKAADALSEDDFASRAGFNLARARALNMGVPSGSGNVVPFAPPGSPSSSSSAPSGAVGGLNTADQRELLRLLSLIERNTKDTSRNTEDLVDMQDDGGVLSA